MLTTYLDDWLSRKHNRPHLTIREARTSHFKYSQWLGSRSHFAVVYLRGEPAQDFTFRSHADWPEPKCDYTIAVLDGILDELLANDLGGVIAGIHFILESIEWHDVDSCEIAYYRAARGAVRDILGRDRYPTNVASPIN